MLSACHADHPLSAIKNNHVISIQYLTQQNFLRLSSKLVITFTTLGNRMIQIHNVA